MLVLIKSTSKYKTKILNDELISFKLIVAVIDENKTVFDAGPYCIKDRSRYRRLITSINHQSLCCDISPPTIIPAWGRGRREALRCTGPACVSCSNSTLRTYKPLSVYFPRTKYIGYPRTFAPFFFINILSCCVNSVNIKT